MGYPKREARGARAGGGKFKDRSNGRPDMFSATCADCGNNCQVPFKPTGSKPIYCSDCFEDKGGSDSRRSGGRDFGGGRNFGGDREMFKTTCDDCGDTCEVPFKPSNGKKVFCSPCFDKGGSAKKSGGDAATAKQLEQINRKLDILMDLLRD